MGLDKKGMAGTVIAKMRAVPLPAEPSAAAAESYNLAVWEAICEGIIAHIHAAAELDGTVASGLGAGGHVTGKIL